MSPEYTRPPTPTWYNSPYCNVDIRFESRHEARWAVMFDHLGWDWQYERYVFESSGLRANEPRLEPPYAGAIWIPDFALKIPDFEIVCFAEVKPWSMAEDFLSTLRKTQRALSSSPPNPNARNVLFLGESNRICFGNGKVRCNRTWIENVDFVADLLRDEDRYWKEETETILAEDERNQSTLDYWTSSAASASSAIPA